MIDTVVLKVNNLDKYPLLYEQFFNTIKKKNAHTIAMVEASTGEVQETTFVVNRVFHDTGNYLPLSHNSNLYIPSSHYTLSYFLNHTANTLEFNFSIPKYVYGTNLIQFINVVDQGFTAQLNLLFSFFRDFFVSHFTVVPLWSDIEVSRIDFCYNQFFNNKSDALSYLHEQKKLNAKYARASRNNFRSYDTSLMYVTKRYSFKIYHKGTEFKVHDRKQLLKSNPKGYDLDWMQQQADNILRYEVSFRKSYFDYIVAQFFFESNDKVQAYNHHPLYSFSRKLGRLSSTRSSGRFINQKTMLEQWRERRKSYTLESPFDVTFNFDLLYNNSNISFDYFLFTELYTFFWNKVDAYQLETCLNTADVIERVNKHNELVDLQNKVALPGCKQKRKTSPLLILSLVAADTKNITDLYKQGILKKTTYYKIKKELKALNLVNATDLAIPKPRTDYYDYRIYFSKFH